MTLYTYTIPFDDGSAPNPFNGMCSLAICKPRIRNVAKVGDWVAGLGSKNAPGGDLSGRLVYAMRIEEVVSMRDYDLLSAQRWPHRVPDTRSKDLSERLGDCIYDFGGVSPKQRPGVHSQQNMKRDLSGRNVLISQHFYYFGSKAIKLPHDLLPLAHQAQGHKSSANEVLLPRFQEWLEGLNLEVGQLYGWPDCIIDWSGAKKGYGCPTRACDDEQPDA